MSKIFSLLFFYFFICTINRLYCCDIKPIYKENCWFAFNSRARNADARPGARYDRARYIKKYPFEKYPLIKMFDYFEFDASKINIMFHLIKVPSLFALFSPINLFFHSSPYLLPSYVVMSLGLSTTWWFSILYFYNTVQHVEKGKFFIKKEDDFLDYLISVKNGQWGEEQTEAKAMSSGTDEHICHCEDKKALFNHESLKNIQLDYSIKTKIRKAMFLKRSTYLFPIFLAMWFLYVRNVTCSQSFNISPTYKIFMEGMITIPLHIGFLIIGNITMRHALTGYLISCYKDFVMRFHNI